MVTIIHTMTTEVDNTDFENDGPEPVIFQTNKFRAVSSFDGDEESDLCIKFGDVLTITATRTDGWWKAENERGEQGFVPSNYLEEIGTDVDESDHEEEKNDTKSEEVSQTGKILWSSVRKSLRKEFSYYDEEPKLDSVLSALGALPAGMQQSILHHYSETDRFSNLQYHLFPHLNNGGLYYRDLFWNHELNKPRKRRVKLFKILRLTRVENVQMHKITGMEQYKPRIRLCLFDGKRPVSNIHVIQAQTNQKKPKTWTFLDKLTDKQKCVEFGEFFVRANYNTPNIDIKTNDTVGEISCGWFTIPLFNDNGIVVLEDKTYTATLNTGNPLDKESTKSNLTLSGSTGKLRQMINQNAITKVVFKVSNPGALQQDQLDIGPDLLIWNTLFIPYVAYYGYILGKELLVNWKDPRTPATVFNPFLTIFMQIADQPDMMDLLRTFWNEREKMIKKEIKRDYHEIGTIFKNYFNETMFAFYNTIPLPPYQLCNENDLMIRETEIFQFRQSFVENKGASQWLKGLENSRPFRPSEFTLFVCP